MNTVAARDTSRKAAELKVCCKQKGYRDTRLVRASDKVY